jgi:hypothetical protein
MVDIGSKWNGKIKKMVSKYKIQFYKKNKFKSIGLPRWFNITIEKYIGNDKKYL